MDKNKLRKIFVEEIHLNPKIKNEVVKFTIWILGAVILTIFTEYLNNGMDNVNFQILVYCYPQKLFVGFLIILIFSSVFLFTKKKWSVYLINILPIFLLDIIDYLCILFRGTSLVLADFYSIPEGLKVIGKYISINKIIFSIFVISTIIFCIHLISRSEKAIEAQYKVKKGMLIIFLLVVTHISICNVLDVKNLNRNYFTLWENIIGSVKYYQMKSINIDLDLVNKVNEEVEEKIKETSTDVKPNIIIVQLESFFDPRELNNVEINKDILKNYDYIRGKSENGIVDVPTYGGGTILSEFEMLTGYDLDLLPSSTLPQKTFLQKVKIESMASILAEEGYDTNLIHNYERSFYSRDKCYKNLGFQKFISLEDMDNIPTEYEWSADLTNLKYVESCLNNEAPQFIYNITVEGHAPYGGKVNDSSYIVGIDEEDCKNELITYINKLEGTDEYLGELFDYLQKLKEPTVLILFSDHLPAATFMGKDNGYLNENKYKTSCTIWNNMGYSFGESEMELYLLGGKVLDTLGINMGHMWTFHKYKDEWENYYDLLSMLQWKTINQW